MNGHRKGTAWPAEMPNRARVMRSSGDSVRTIASALGVPRATVADWLAGQDATYMVTCGFCGVTFHEDARPGGRRLRYCSEYHQKMHYLAKRHEEATGAIA